MNERQYKIKDHLGNVRAVVSDVKQPRSYAGSPSSWDFGANLLNISNYYPYGLPLPGGEFSVNADYSYGFNGMEKDDSTRGKGVNYDFGARIYSDGVFLSVDPRVAEFSNYSSYIFAGGNPVNAIDPDGEASLFINGQTETEGGQKKYWNRDDGSNVADDYMNTTGDHNAFFIDGSMGGLFGSGLHNTNPIRRKLDGQTDIARKIANKILDDVEKTGESIKVIGHSLGPMYARGLVGTCKVSQRY